MHAASVNPEPGSNSLKNVYLNPVGLKYFFRANFNLSFLLLLSYLLKCFDKNCTIVLLFFVLFNFQWSSACSVQACTLYNIQPKKSRGFLIFFGFFWCFLHLLFFDEFHICFLCNITISNHCVAQQRNQWRHDMVQTRLQIVFIIVTKRSYKIAYYLLTTVWISVIMF